MRYVLQIKTLRMLIFLFRTFSAPYINLRCNGAACTSLKIQRQQRQANVKISTMWPLHVVCEIFRAFLANQFSFSFEETSHEGFNWTFVSFVLWCLFQ